MVNLNELYFFWFVDFSQWDSGTHLLTATLNTIKYNFHINFGMPLVTSLLHTHIFAFRKRLSRKNHQKSYVC